MANGSGILAGLGGGASALRKMLELQMAQQLRGQEREARQGDVLELLRERMRLQGEQAEAGRDFQAEQAGTRRQFQTALALAQQGVAPEGFPQLDDVATLVAEERQRAKEEAQRSARVSFAKEQAVAGLTEPEFNQVFQTKFGELPDEDTRVSFGALSAARRRDAARSRLQSRRDRILDNLRALRVQGADIEPYIDLYGVNPGDPEVQRIMQFEPQLGFDRKELNSALEDAETRIRDTGQPLFVSQQEVEGLKQGVPEDVANQRLIMMETRRSLRRSNPQAWQQMVSRATQNEGDVPMADPQAEAAAVVGIRGISDPNQLLQIIATARDNPDVYADQGVNPEAIRRAAEDRLQEVNVMTPEELAPTPEPATGVRGFLGRRARELGPGTLDAMLRFTREFDEAGRGGS